MIMVDIDSYGYPIGSKKSKAASLYSEGATAAEVKDILGDQCLNVLSEVQSIGFKVIKKKVRVSKSIRTHYRYQIVKE